MTSFVTYYGTHARQNEIYLLNYDLLNIVCSSSFCIFSRRYNCTGNKPVRLENVPFVHKYPGVHYSFAQQCHLEYNKNYSEFTGGVSYCTISLL